MDQLKNQDDDDDDNDDVEDDEDDEFLFVPIMNTPSLTSNEEEVSGFPTLSEALFYDLNTYNFDLVGLLQSSEHEFDKQEQQYFHHTTEENISECSPEAIADNDDPEEKKQYDRMYRAIQCINFCRHYVKHEKEKETPVEFNTAAQITVNEETHRRFDIGKRISDAYISFWTKQNQRSSDNGETFQFHHPVLENDAYLFHVEDLLNLCSDSVTK
jgi:hypothetical protein